ncbi:MAG: hypothetical protein LBQ51_08550 [Desulfovibrio sp.]|nr:hypothetical protein [Desulfovibrio sp.]
MQKNTAFLVLALRRLAGGGVPYGVQKNTVFLVLALALLLQACAGAQAPHLATPSEEQNASADRGAEIWQSFRERAEKGGPMDGPFRLSAGLRYTDTKGSTRRAAILLWGNGMSGAPLPLRLDLQVGMGMVAAKIREDGQSTLLYIPNENTAYLQQDEQRSLTSFGVPLPFSLSDLALLLTGRWGPLFLPPDGKDAVPEHRPSAGGCRFTLRNAALPGLLELSFDGTPLVWRGENGWTIEIPESAAGDPMRPERLRVFHARGDSALISVRESERVSPPYTGEQTSLILPPGTIMKSPPKTAAR